MLLACMTAARSNEMTEQPFDADAKNDVGRLQEAIDGGVPVDLRDSEGRTPLLIATRANSINAARVLIDLGADVNAKDHIEDSPFLYAGAEGRLEILKMTVKAGADLGSTNRYGGTALIPAAHHGHVETVRFLLTTDIKIDHVNKLGWTALLEAVILGDGSPAYQDIVEALLEAGADASIGDNNGTTPLEHAERNGFREIADIVRSASR
jgi:ankyrin repeat protein